MKMLSVPSRVEADIDIDGFLRALSRSASEVEPVVPTEAKRALEVCSRELNGKASKMDKATDRGRRKP